MRAARSATKPGCRRFDVIEPLGEADRVMLYEIYDDRAAFEAHVQTAHFLMLRCASAATLSPTRRSRMRPRLRGIGIVG